jgi:hypothetical protein
MPKKNNIWIVKYGYKSTHEEGSCFGSTIKKDLLLYGNRPTLHGIFDFGKR